MLIEDISDNFPCIVSFNKQYKRYKDPLEFKCRKLTEEKINLLNSALSTKSCDHIKSQDVNTCFNTLHSTILAELDKITPEKDIIIPSRKITREPWITSGIRKSGSELRKLYKNVKLLDSSNALKVEYKLKAEEKSV